MQRKSTEYKKLAGTYKATREAPLRPLAELEADLDCCRSLLEDMRLNLSLSSEAIRTRGMRMTFVSLNKNSHFVERVKSNPALRIQHEAIRNVRSLTVEIAHLEEQVAAASKKKVDDDSWAELGA